MVLAAPREEEYSEEEFSEDDDAGSEPEGPPLFTAASFGRTAAVRRLLAEGADTDARNCNRFGPDDSALHVAARWGHLEVVLLLLAKVVGASAKNSGGDTPLHYAAAVSFGHDQLFTAEILGRKEAVVRQLLQHGAEVSAMTEDGLTPLHDVATEEMARVLLQHGADASAKSNDGCTPMHSAAGNGREAVIRVLSDNGADVSVVSEHGDTPLSFAASHGDPAVVQLLLDKGASASTKNSHGSTPLHCALTMMDDSGGDGGEKVARSFRREALVRMLLAHGADVWAMTEASETPLHGAAAGGFVTEVLLLLERGADPSSKETVWGRTPLHQAAMMGRERTVRVLLKHGADVFAKDAQGKTPEESLLAKRRQFGHYNKDASNPPDILQSLSNIGEMLRARAHAWAAARKVYPKP
jgi:cytohesin